MQGNKLIHKCTTSKTFPYFLDSTSIKVSFIVVEGNVQEPRPHACSHEVMSTAKPMKSRVNCFY